MASADLTSFLRATLLFALTAASSHALQLGESEAQVTARHGAAAVEDHARQLAVYYWEGWSAQLVFKKGVVGKLTYRRNSYLEDAEIQSLLQANGGVARWRETTSLGTKARRWVRDDGALATTDAARPTGLVFQADGTAAEGLSPAEAIVADSFLKFDAPANPPVRQPLPAGPQNEPVVRSNAPQPILLAEPLLRVDAVQSEIFAPAPEPPAAAAVASEQTHEMPAEKTAPPAAPKENAVVQSRRTENESGGVLFMVIWGVGLIGAVLFFLLRNRRPARPTPSVRPVSTPPPVFPPAPVTPIIATRDAQTLDSLRADQIELLLGEIFRREGYTIELSAALGSDGRSDLTLRRDGESIPVQSKDWKADRITEREVREFYGIMAGTAAPRGIFVTTGSCSNDARKFAADKSIELIDRSGLEQRIAAVRRPDENFFEVSSWIEDFAAYARVFDPECPCCNQAMVIRHHRLDGSAAWACTTYPRCPGKRETRRDLLPLSAAA